MKASLIISIYNNIRFLKAVLDSLHYQTEKDFEIIIAEDGKNTAVKEFIDNYPFEHPWHHLTQKDEGWRKNQSMNKAIQASKADWLIFIDGDCVLHHRFIEMHLRYANENHVLAGKRVKLDKTISSFVLEDSVNIQCLQKIMLKKIIHGKGHIRYIEEGIFISPDNLFGFIPKLRTLNHLTGSNMSFSRKAIFAINGFDEDYLLPAVGEDYDLTWRFKAAGYEHKSVRNLAVQYHLRHHENWFDQDENMRICRKKQLDNNFVCKNGLIKLI
jgi:cellulose synthase/poly-beta-1,6-N-acetylglucosamine synthase-like glycosyltransferase